MKHKHREGTVTGQEMPHSGYQKKDFHMFLPTKFQKVVGYMDGSHQLTSVVLHSSTEPGVMESDNMNKPKVKMLGTLDRILFKT